MKTFTFILCILALTMVSVQSQFTSLRGLAHGGPHHDDDDKDCTERNDECDDDEDCCGSNSVCVPAAFTTTCRTWFLGHHVCENKDKNNDCCDLYTVCKKCRDEDEDCLIDDQCCDDMECVIDKHAHGGDKKHHAAGKCKATN